MIEPSEPRFFEFEDHRLDGISHRLFHRATGELVPLTPKAVELLVYLVANRGRTLSKHELLDAVWGNSFIEESNLSQTIFVLRKTLGENTKQPRFIRTRPGIGYEFIADVRRTGVEEPAAAKLYLVNPPAEVASVSASAAPRKPFARLTRIAYVVLPLLVVAVIAVVWFYPLKPNPNGAKVTTLAVLPFQGLGNDPNLAYLGPGLADVLVTKLSRIKNVVVRPASASAKYSEPSADPVKAGAELGVDSVLTGRVQTAGDNLRISVQLVRVSDGATIWADTFDNRMTSILAVQDSIAAQVAQSLAIQLGQEERRRVARNYTDNPQAFQLYLQGRFLWSKRTPETLLQAIAEFDKAKQLDPAYALAYVGAAECYVLLPQYKVATPQEAYTNAKRELQSALAIDEELAEAHSTLAHVQAFYDWNWAAADVSFRRALELDPNSVTARLWFAEFLYMTDRRDESEAQLRRGLTIEPRSTLLLSSLASSYYYRRDYDQSLEYSRQVLAIDPANFWGHFYRGQALEHKGQYAEAVDAYAKAAVSFGEPPEGAAALRQAFEKGGMEGFWRQRLQQLETEPYLKFVPPMAVAYVHARLGHREEAMQFLQKAFDERDHNIGGLKNAVDYDLLIDDPRLRKIIAQVGN